MTQNTAPAPVTGPPAQKGKAERLQTYLGVTSTTLGILGALGTAFVWLASSVYVGEVSINTDKPVDSLMVKVVDKKGQSLTYYGTHVSLMPGTYHLEIGVPDINETKHTDATVELWKQTAISYAVPSGAESKQARPEGRKHWWQFWKKKAA